MKYMMSTSCTELPIPPMNEMCERIIYLASVNLDTAQSLTIYIFILSLFGNPLRMEVIVGKCLIVFRIAEMN